MYPTLEQVNSAKHVQLGYWYRFLPSPGTSAINKANFNVLLNKQALIMNRIVERFKELGGMTSEISKKIGWD